MTIAGKAVLVTGANRGIGRALADEALRRGAAVVYAGTRQPFTHPDARVTSLSVAADWRGGFAKALERQYAAIAAEVAAAA
jgi:NAD(P)-dependent dehydrogenase (short-subunit alcohol dehydrogenase family)